ncbi:hypothetical protein RAN64_16270, partial [Enterococcus lactis]|nr:hypothetical protein [Enterococcus lactis]
NKISYVLPLIEGLFFYRRGIFKYQRLSWKSCATPLVFPSGSFVARIITYTFLLGKLRMLKDTW